MKRTTGRRVSRGGNAAVTVSAFAVLALVVAGLIGRALMGDSTKPGPQEPEYLDSLSGSLQRHPRKAQGKVASGVRDAMGTAPASGSRRDVRGEPETASTGTEGLSGFVIEESPRVRSPGGATGDEGRGGPREMKVTTREGQALARAMTDPDVLVRALAEPDGSYIYVRGSGWMKLDGASWVSVAGTDLPAGLRARYPLETLAASAGRGGARKAVTGITGSPSAPHSAIGSTEPEPVQGPDSLDPTITYSVTPELGGS